MTEIAVDPSKIKAQLGTGLRDLALALGVAKTTIAFIAAKDVDGLLTYMQSEGFLTVAAMVLVVAIPAWRQWSARHEKKKMVALAETSPIGVVK